MNLNRFKPILLIFALLFSLGFIAMHAEDAKPELAPVTVYKNTDLRLLLGLGGLSER